jgi:hypothetical protein
LILWDLNISQPSFGKSVPTIPITSTEENNDADNEKYIADPPRIKERVPFGVLRLSSAIEPTTVMSFDII